MSRLCVRCARRCVERRVSRRHCRSCYNHEKMDTAFVPLPAGHPFTIEREARIERMRQRVERGESPFESVDPDLK